jgi:phage portal protein BeeE
LAQFPQWDFPGVAIEFDAGIRLPDEADLNRIEARLLARYGGESNSNKPIFVPPGAKLQAIQLSAQELAFVESTDQLRDQILALFGVSRFDCSGPFFHDLW